MKAIAVTAWIIVIPSAVTAGALPPCVLHAQTSVVPISTCASPLKVFQTRTGSPWLAHYERAYACFRKGRLSESRDELNALTPQATRLNIQAQLAKSVISYRLHDKREAVRAFQAAQLAEAAFAHVPITRVRAPTGAEPALFGGSKTAFKSFLPIAIAFERVQREDAFVKRGVDAVFNGSYCKGAELFSAGMRTEKSSSARWLYGDAALLIGDRRTAIAQWLDVIFEPEDRMSESFNQVQWSSVALAVAAITDE